MSTHRKTSKRALEVEERRKQCVALRLKGWTYEQIGEEVGIDPAAAYRHVSAALKRVRTETLEGATEIVEMELRRIDAMLKGLWEAAGNGDVQAVDRVLKLMIRRAKYLQLDAPQQVEQLGSFDPEQIRASFREMLRKRPDVRAALLGREGGNGKAPHVH